MAKNEGQHEVSYAELKRRVDDTLVSADSMRAKGIQGLGRLRRIKAVTLAREALRLRDEEAADEVELAEIARAATRNARVIGELERESSRLRALDEKIAPGTMTVSGHVRGPGGQGVRGLTVALRALDERLADAVLEAATDDEGYYLLHVGEDSPPSGRAPKASPSKGKAAGRTPSPDWKGLLNESVAAGGGAAGAKTKGEIEARLTIRGLRNRGLRTLEPPVVLRADTRDYREVLVPSKELPDAGGHPAVKRYLGNRRSTELHDLENEQRRCQIAKIRPEAREHFDSAEEALAHGYDLCAHCFGKERSKR